jgi:hypothetical protein
MPSLRRDLRSQLENSVLKARELAEQGAREALATLGVDQAKPFEHLKPDQKALRNQLRARGRQAGDALADTGRQEIEHLAGITAYEHWHRMLFARFLAENSLLLEPDHQVPVSLADVEELAREAKTDVWELAGRFAQRMLPAVFRADDPVLALPLARETRVQLERLVADLPREVFLADDSLGWTYQFWQAKRKEEVNKSGVKIGADELSPVTQLFTEDYMVEFLLHNTLGAWWAGRKGAALGHPTEPEARAAVSLPPRNGIPGLDWTYLRLVQDEATKQWRPAAGTFDGWPRSTRELTVLDPSMGSGHFLVFALPLLARLRVEEEGLGAGDAIAAVLRDNLHGLELDDRCTQIAAFNVALAAWKLGGYQPLPPLALACSGLAPHATETEWTALAGGDARLRFGMAQLFRLFAQAPKLGSLINPRAVAGAGFAFDFHELHQLLTRAVGNTSSADEAVREMAVTASGLARAADILAGHFTLVVTNVPYLGRGKQDDALREYCERVHPDAKADLATCFVERCLEFCSPDAGSTALVTPQNWLFLGTYKHLRKTLLEQVTWDGVARLGERGFESQAAAGAFTALLTFSRRSPAPEHQLCGIDASAPDTPAAKAEVLVNGKAVQVGQAGQLENPDGAVSFDASNYSHTLKEYGTAYQGIATSDYSQFGRSYWELSALTEEWVAQQSTVEHTVHYGGLEHVLFWEKGLGRLSQSAQARIQGLEAIGKVGVVVSQMRQLPAALFSGSFFDNNCSALVVDDPKNLPAIWAFCSSLDYNRAVRAIDQKVSVTNATLVKVPIDLAHWGKVAAEKYPHGLPKPFSSDPTQWLFNGLPKGSDQPLHVGLARLVGYQWPRQTGSSFPDCPALPADGLAEFADEDGIVCLTPLRGERSGADRLRTLLSAALGDHDEQALIRATQSKANSLEAWLRDECFAQHCAVFHHRPFIWHLWDGRSDGFHALVNYHKLAAADGAGRKLLETLTYSYLGDWIRAQQDGLKRNEAGSEDRLIAAQALQKELEAILRGEPPYDLFVRWKPLHQQAIGWEPDINDGVRMNIRPFLLANDVGRKGAGILRAKPNIKWDKDRGTEPERPKTDFPWFWSWDETTEDFTGGSEFDGCRWNSCHYTLAAKRAARAKAK